MGRQVGLSHNCHQTHLANLRPLASPGKTFPSSLSDPFFVEKVRSIVGLYLNPRNRSRAIAASRG